MRRSSLAVLYLTVFIDLLGFGIILPLLPYCATQWGATGIWIGALLTAYSVAQFIGAPVLGRLSDRYGRRPILLLSLAGSTLSFALSGLAGGLWTLLAARALAGLFGGSIAAAQAYIADVTTPNDRARYMGLLGAAIGLGFIFGPALGAAMRPYGFGAAAFVSAGLAGLNLIVAAFRLEEPPHVAASAERMRHPLAELSHALRHPVIGRVVAAMFLVTFGFVAMETTLALLGEKRFGMTSRGFGLLLAFAGVVMVIVQGGLVGRLTARFGERALAVAGAALMAVGLLALPFSPSFGPAVAFVALMAAGQALANPTLATLLSKASEADEQGGTLGLGQSISAAARAIGPMVAGALYDIRAFAPYLVAATLTLLAGVLIGGRRRAPAPAMPAPAAATER